MGILMHDYQQAAKRTRAYSDYGQQTIGPISYCALGLAGEAGEVANKVKKVLRGDFEIAVAKEAILDEIGDVLWYCAMLADELGADLGVIADNNLTKLALRRAANTIKGEGDAR